MIRKETLAIFYCLLALLPLNSARPTKKNSEQKALPKPQNVNLVLVDGCINDVGAFTIAHPFTPSFIIETRAKDFCYYDMKNLLNKIQEKFVNAKIIVTGYWQGVSHKSDISEIIDYIFTYVNAWLQRGCSAFGGPACGFVGNVVLEWTKPLLRESLKSLMVKNWGTWKDSSTRYLS